MLPSNYILKIISFPELLRHFKLLKQIQQLEAPNLFVTTHTVYFLNCAGTSKLD